MTNHPITPPPELVQQWQASLDCPDNSCAQAKYIAAQAARWGADQELEACVEWVVGTIPSWAPHTFGEQLRAARRPKPPNLKAQALAALSRADKDALTNPLTGEVVALRTILSKEQSNTIRRALEALDD